MQNATRSPRWGAVGLPGCDVVSATLASRQSMVRRSRPVTWLSIDGGVGGRPREKRSRSSERYSPLGPTAFVEMWRVFERNVLLEPGEDELVDLGDVSEDLGRFADPIPTIRRDMMVDQ